MNAPVKAGHGERKKQAREAIEKFQDAQQLWGSKELATELGCSQSQAHQLIQSLFVDGVLVRGPRTVVVPDAFLIAA